MILTVLIFAVLFCLAIASSIQLQLACKRQVKQLFLLSPPGNKKTYHSTQLAGLPPPVQRYFMLVLPEGQAYISSARLIHEGQFKTALNKPWAPITGKQYFTTEKPGFIWIGKTNLFTARDMYMAGEGRLLVSLFSFLTIANGRGDNYNEGELQRWLAESVWFPTNLLPRPNLQWLPIDDTSATLQFTYCKVFLRFKVTFNESGEIASMETRRFMVKETRETWICTMFDYKKIAGILVPAAARASWKLPAGNYDYASFSVRQLEYDQPRIW